MQRLLISLAPLTLACLLLPPSSRADSKPATSTDFATGPKSVFVDDPGFGKDPFFPRSLRRPTVMVKPSDLEPSRTAVPDFIVLRGISVQKDKKLAIINNYTVAEGEEVALRFGAQVVKVKCVEIKERAVIVSVNGVTKEQPLRAGF